MMLYLDTLFSLLAPLILFHGGGAYAQVQSKDKLIEINGEGVDGEYIFVLKDTVKRNSFSTEAVQAVAFQNIVIDMVDKKGVEEIQLYTHAFQGFFVGGIDRETALEIAEDDNVVSVEQNQVFTLDVVDQSPATYGIDRLDKRDLPLDNTYFVEGDGTGITAYIIDTGIRTSHDEFKAEGSTSRASFGANTSGDGIDRDCDGHGTHVAGIVGGSTFGVAKNVELIAVKVFDCANRFGDTRTIIDGIEWVQQHAQENGKTAVANMSLSGPASPALDAAVRSLHNSGVTTIASAGNDNIDACGLSPAREPAVITVGSTTNIDARSSFSNFGSCLDIFAPGSNILSAGSLFDSQTTFSDGTSGSAPHVCGAVALLLEKGIDAENVSQEILARATEGKVKDAGVDSDNKLLYVGEIPTIDLVTIFEEDFDDGPGNFSNNIKIIENRNCFGLNESCLRVKKQQKASSRFKPVSDFSEVKIEFIYYTTSKVSSDENLTVEYRFNGETWKKADDFLPEIKVWQHGSVVVPVPPGKKQFKFRFLVDLDKGNENFYIDDVALRGKEI